MFRLALGPTWPFIQWVMGYLPRGKAAGHEVSLLPVSSAEVKNEWNYTSTCHHGVDREYYLLPLLTFSI